MNNKDSLIARFSMAFVKKSRITFLLFITIIGLGTLSYTTFLKREGFPPVEIPFTIVQTPYFVDDVQKVDKDITRPIEQSISDIKEIKQITSNTLDNFSIIFAEFTPETTSEQGAKLLKDEINNDVTLPEGVDVQYQTLNAGTYDGIHDMLLTISNTRDIKEIQKKAQFVAKELQKLNEVVEAEVIELITEETNPITKETFDYRSGFNRVGIRNENNELVFKDGIQIGIIKQEETGTIELSDAVTERINDLEKEGELKGYTVILNGDFAESLKLQINSLETNLLSGLIVVVFILFLFVNWRASIVTAIFIPLVMAATFAVLFLLGYSLNTLTLFSLILVLGLFVDDAIVVVESIDYHKKQGKRGIEAIAAAINGIGIADISGTVTTVLVFTPMLFISGILGEFIVFIPITVITALVVSLLIALAIIPFLTNIFIPDSKDKKKAGRVGKMINMVAYGFSNFIQKLAELSSNFVRWYLFKPAVAAFIFIMVNVLMFAFGGYFASKLKFSIFPAPKDTDEVLLAITYLPGTEIEQAEDIAIEVEDIMQIEIDEDLMRYDYFFADKESVMGRLVLTPLNDRKRTSRDMVEVLNERFENYEKARVKLSQSGAGTSVEDFPFQVQVFDEDPKILKKSTEEIKTYLIDLELTAGEKITEVFVGDLSSISKIDKNRFAVVKAKTSDSENTQLLLDAQSKVEKEFDSKRLTQLNLSEDALQFDFGQESENLESFNSTIFALAVSMLLMYGLLVLQFDSFSKPFLIFSAIPLGFPGLFPGLFFTDNPLGFFALLGIMGLLGIVVNNTIMLMDFADQERAKGKGIRTSIVDAVRIRFRPLVTTSATTIAGLLPLALTDPFWEPLTVSIIFGIASSTTLVIFVFPLFYSILEYLRTLKGKTWGMILAKIG